MCTSWKDSQDTLCLVFSNLQQGELSINDVNDDAHVIKLQNEFETGKYKLSKKSRTAKLWIQYLDFIATLKMYIKAERIGNWTMQLECTRKMLNFFFCRYGSCKLRQECQIVLADYVETKC